MRAKLASSGMLIATLLLAACDDGSPDVKIEDVDVFLARICELGAQCPDISATQEELDACPLEIRSKLSGAGLTELGRFTTYTKSQQDCVLECIGRAICDRFGEALSNMSDSDVLEPFRECEQECL
jgi:hypothetical protein